MIWGIRRRLATVFKQDSIQKNGAIVSRFFKGGMITLRVDNRISKLDHDDDDDDDDVIY